MLIHPELKKAHEKVEDVNPYYVKKYEYLEKYGFFRYSKPIEFGELTEDMIKDSLCQTPQVTFETTDYCNLNCTYCSFGNLYEGFDERNHKNIDIRSAEKLLKYIFENKPQNEKQKFLIGFYGGEPLFNGEFIKAVVRYVNELKSKKNMDVEYNITTNALLIDKYIDFFVDNKFKILISLDGNEKNHSYRVLRKSGENSFNKVVHNIDVIQRKYPEYFSKYVRFNAVLHDRNSVKEINEFIYRRYNKIPRISPLVMVDVNSKNRDTALKMFRDKRTSEIEFEKEETDLYSVVHSEFSIYKELTDFLKFYSFNYYISNITFLLSDLERYLPTSTCLPGQKKILLTTTNRLLPCERVNYKYTIGEVENDVVLDISKITKRYKFYYDHIKNMCQKCYANRACNACLFHMRMLDKIDKEDFVCESFCDAEELKCRLKRVFSFLEKYPSYFSEIVENLVIV